MRQTRPGAATAGPARVAGVAACAGVTVAAGAVIMLVALVAAEGSWRLGYVSEAGTAAQRHAVAYRSGLILLAVGVALLGLAFLLESRDARRARVVAVLLALAAALAGTSGAVPCSNQCPLPPFEPTTTADVVHTGVSIAGITMLAGAMLAAALAGLGTAVRRMAAVALTLTVPLGVALGLTMLLAGRGTLGATLERLLLFVAVSWLVGTSCLTVVRNTARQL